MLSQSTCDPVGSAPTILYLHGLGAAGWTWDPVIVALPGYGAVVPDLPGHGGSCDLRWSSLAETAAAVAESLDHLPAERPVYVAGHSLGAYVGLILLTLRPARFAGAILSGFHLSSPGRSTLLKLAYVANGVVFRIPPLLRRFGSVFADPTVERRFVDGARVIRSRTIRRAGIQVVAFEPPAGLDALTLPILAIAGSGEPEGIRSAPGELAGRVPNVEPRVLSGRDHLWPMKEPGTYADAIRGQVEGSRKA